MDSLYISRVVIKNYRNFKDLDVNLQHKSVIVGENNVGKTNFIKALQLILDPSLSDEDRMLSESDFNDSLKNPMENNQEILIQIYISNYRRNVAIMTMLSDATVLDAEGNEVLLLSYKFFPHIDEFGKKEYQYEVYMRDDMSRKFGSRERKYLNIKVIKALRDVEADLRNSKKSPVKKMLDDYKISKEVLENIASEYKECGDRVLDLDEINDMTMHINERFSEILGNHDYDISLQAMEVDPTRVLGSLKMLMANRSVSDSSLGLDNILYISLVLQMLKDKTVPTFVSGSEYSELLTKENSEIIDECYISNAGENYVLRTDLNEENYASLYTFMADNGHGNNAVTLLAIEEPEAHLHPVYQRLIYKDVINRNGFPILLTTHSTHITSVVPIKSLVHLHQEAGNTVAHSTASMPMLEGEFLDVERYLDVKRGEIFLGKGVILVEGIAEEYIIPKLAELLGKPLDEKGIVVCNINCTNFKPYMKMLNSLSIPYAVITDGDFYIENVDDRDDSNRNYHVMEKDVKDNDTCGSLGRENAIKTFEALDDSVPENVDLALYFSERGYFIGKYTFEVDMMECTSTEAGERAFTDTFDQLVESSRKQNNFKNRLENQDYEFCLRRIEDQSVGKGRFAQIFSGKCVTDNCPDYVKNAIEYIYAKVDE
ncbi:putative ATP-dependent endonuclease of the OLD family [Streptococcus gallolyticus subsp. gallolyticus ATCC BAA-2069]|uniref:ATP-dependent nuclease n=1 Tax=Streptococcus gallolyticus TaxID=315405 RepID=UPI000201B976|nr:AAA family ATPase [Streptococcus gallolyticus]CBZ48221.1 putative ATP-dependent endonuclease of the OLD family [Streptococcus gallolyticus subsp. gallolyticus ATCC BAA-2069]